MGFATLCLVFFMAEIAVKTIAASITQVNKTTWLTSAFKVAFGSSRRKFIRVLKLFIQVGLLLAFATFPKGRHSFPQFTLAQEGL